MKNAIFNLHKTLCILIAEIGNRVFFFFFFIFIHIGIAIVRLICWYSICIFQNVYIYDYIFSSKNIPFLLNTRYKMHETFLYLFTDVKSKYTQRINQRSARKQNIIFTDCKIGHYRHSYIEIYMHSSD